MSSAKIFAEKAKNEFTVKADHNKRESLLCIIMILVCSLIAPLFITLGEGVILAKAVPSVLSVLSAGFTSWLQLRKPQKLWSMYRNTQRLIENEIAKHEFAIGDYSHNEKSDSLLVERVSFITLNTHNEWINLVPAPETMPITQSNQRLE